MRNRYARGSDQAMDRQRKTREKLIDAMEEALRIYGYQGTSLSALLKTLHIPKGSMYHYFKGKKALVLAMVQERLFPKMEAFFDFSPREGQGVTEALRDTFAAMSRNKPLITYGCPLYRLMVELSPVDQEFDALLTTKVAQLRTELAALLQRGIESGEFSVTLDTEAFAAYLLESTWGVLSLSPSLSSSRHFIAHSRFILDTLNTYRVTR